MESEKMELISSYTQEEAIEDGILCDITKTKEVQEAGFKVPVVITAGVNELLNFTDHGQSFAGRLWDLLTMAKYQIKTMLKTNDYFGKFTCLFYVKQGGRYITKNYTFFIVFNEYEGYTIMFPEDY